MDLSDRLARFIGERTSLYLGTASASGRPYIQHRGGPPGFLKVLGPSTLGFADFSGNRQYLSVGNLAENDKALMFPMDYAGRARFKLWGRARFVDDSGLIERLRDDDYGASIEPWSSKSSVGTSTARSTSRDSSPSRKSPPGSAPCPNASSNCNRSSTQRHMTSSVPEYRGLPRNRVHHAEAGAR